MSQRSSSHHTPASLFQRNECIFLCVLYYCCLEVSNVVVSISKSLLLIDCYKHLRLGSMVKILFSPTSTSSLDDFIVTKNCLVMHVLENVTSKLCHWKYTPPSPSTSLSPSASACASTMTTDVVSEGLWEFIGVEQGKAI